MTNTIKNNENYELLSYINEGVARAKEILQELNYLGSCEPDDVMFSDGTTAAMLIENLLAEHAELTEDLDGATAWYERLMAY